MKTRLLIISVSKLDVIYFVLEVKDKICSHLNISLDESSLPKIESVILIVSLRLI